jgi:RNA polymerase primary sigma factor
MFFGLDCEKKSLEEIANVYGLTRERVRQINEKGIRHLRKSKVFEKYREYL